MKVLKNILLWGLVAFFLLMAIGSGGVSSLFALIPVVLLLPIKKWQDIISKILNNKIKIIAVILAFVLMIAFLPNTENVNDGNSNTETSEEIQDKNETTSLNSAKNETTTKKETKPVTTTELTTTESSTKETREENKTTTKNNVTSTKINTTTKETTTKNTNTSTTKNNVKETTTKFASNTTTVHNHTFIEATCVNAKTCSECGATEGIANGHTWKDATYSSPKTCIVCGTTTGDILEKPGAANYNGHVYTGGENSKKYHYEEHCAGKYSHEITWEEVERRNLAPCGTCVLK